MIIMKIMKILNYQEEKNYVKIICDYINIEK